MALERHVARADLVVSARFQVLQKSQDLLIGQLGHGQLAGVAFLPGHELQEKLEAVTIAVQGVRTHGPLLREIVRQKAVQGNGQERYITFHQSPPE